MNTIDIVIIHTGFNKYLYYSILQAKRTNPNSTVYIIGNKKYKQLENYSTFIDINDLQSADLKLFENNYVHMGKSDYNFEMFCIKRWFLLKNFMKRYNKKQLFHIDSDVMLFSNISYLLDMSSFDGVDMAITCKLALTMCVNNIDVLEDFCTYVLSMYMEKEKLDILKKRFFSGRHLIGVAGSISDMDLSSMYFTENKKYKIMDLSEINNNSVFDVGILHDGSSFKTRKKMKYEIKYVYFKDKIPYCLYIKDSNPTEIKLNSIHFLVWTKVYMEKAFKYKELNFNPIFVNIYREYNVFLKNIKNVLKKISIKI